MPEKKLTPEQNQWAQRIYKHLQWKFPIVEEDPSENAELEDVLLDDASLDDVTLDDPEVGGEAPEQQDELAAKKDTYTADKSKVNKRLRALDKLVREPAKKRAVFVEEDNLSLYDDAQTLAKEQVSLANKIITSPDDDGFVNIESVAEHLDKGEQYLRTMRVAYKQGQDIAVEELKELTEPARQQQQKVDALYKDRKDLAKWDIDLTEFDDAYGVAFDNFTAMNKAITGYIVADVNKALAAAEENLVVLTSANQNAKLSVDTAEADLLRKVSVTKQGIAELFHNRSELESDPAHLTAFDKVYDAATADMALANAAIKERHGREIDSAAQSAGRRLAELQQVFLQAKVGSFEDTEIALAGDGDADDIKQLSGDVAALNKTLESVNEQRGLVKNHGSNFAEFESTYQAARSSIVGEQTDLLAGDMRSAESRTSDVRNNIAGMKGLVKEAEAALDVLADQIGLLRKEVAPLAENRQSFVKLAELEVFGAEQLRKFDAIYGELGALIDHADACMTSQSIDEAYQAIDNSRGGLKKLGKIVDSLLWMPKIDTAATEQEAKESFKKAVTKVRGDIAEFNKKRSVFKDIEELKIFENTHNKAVGFADQADALLAQNKFKQAEDVLENARVTLDGLETVYERGLNTAAKIESNLSEIDEIKARTNAAYEQGMALTNQEHKNDFLSYNTIAMDFALQVEGYFAEGKTKDARVMLDDLRVALANLEDCLTRTPKKKKKKKKTAPQEQPSEVGLHTSEQKELAKQISQTNTAIHIAFTQGRQLVADEYGKNFENAYASGIQHCEEAAALVRSNNVEGAKAAVSATKQALILMQRIQDNSRIILTSLLNGITEGAAYYEQGMEVTYAKRDECADWSIDLTRFDKAYSTAKDNLTNLKAAIKASKAEVAKDTLNRAEGHKQALAEAYVDMKSDRDFARTDLFIQISDVQSALGRLSADRPLLEGNASLSNQFGTIYDTAFAGIQHMLAAMTANNGKAIEKEIPEIEKMLASLQMLLREAEAITYKEIKEPGLRDDERIFATINALQRELNSYNSSKDVFKIPEELSNFESMHDKTKAFVEEAKTLLASGENGEARNVLENAQISMESVEVAFERGQATAAKIDGYQQAVEQANNKVTALYGQRSLIKDEQELATFNDYYKAATDTTSKAETGLKIANFELAEAELGTLNGLIVNMEKFIKLQRSKRHKLKTALKRKGKSKPASKAKK